MEEAKDKELEEAASAECVSPETEDTDALKKELAESKDKYLRFYADFENYKRRMAKDKEELAKYANEALMRELLSVIDHLELALEHSSNSEAVTSIAEGVSMTLKELKGILEKFGLTDIRALGTPFDPTVHDAMAQIDTEEGEDGMIAQVFRKGYMLRDRVLRAALVGVSKRK
ncbi:MAG: nucleotide exchange factor GrpE [Nitrospirae bacterium]|nr:nucleotide exchange factor GrpE [Nitrospirota bacterium]